MRSNEEASSVGALLVAAAADPSLQPRPCSTDAVTARPAAPATVPRARRRPSSRRWSTASTTARPANGSASCVATISQPDPVAVQHRASGIERRRTTAGVGRRSTAAVAYTDLRRFAQDRVAREVAIDADEPGRARPAVIAYRVGVGAIALLFAGGRARAGRQPLDRPAAAPAHPGRRDGGRLSAAELVRVADSDSDDAPAAQLAAVEVDSADEIGELAHALNRVQATAALLLERQVSHPAQRGVMFANIARRTQNLVGRQLGLIDDLERNETQSRAAAAALPARPRGHPAAAQRGQPARRLRHHRPGHVRRPRPRSSTSSGRRWPRSKATRSIDIGACPRSRSPRAWSATCACCWPNCWRTPPTSRRRARGSRCQRRARATSCRIRIVDHGLGHQPGAARRGEPAAARTGAAGRRADHRARPVRGRPAGPPARAVGPAGPSPSRAAITVTDPDPGPVAGRAPARAVGRGTLTARVRPTPRRAAAHAVGRVAAASGRPSTRPRSRPIRSRGSCRPQRPDRRPGPVCPAGRSRPGHRRPYLAGWRPPRRPAAQGDQASHPRLRRPGAAVPAPTPAGLARRVPGQPIAPGRTRSRPRGRRGPGPRSA